VNVVEVATPFAFVVSVSVFVPLLNVPLAPVVGAVKVTATPLTGLVPLLTTVATNGVANAVLIAALCWGVPLFDVIESTCGGVDLDESPQPIRKAAKK
jgi:hypothetical protein